MSRPTCNRTTSTASLALVDGFDEHVPASVRHARVVRHEHLTALRRDLLAWGEEHRRDLPWRRTRDPWAILVSRADAPADASASGRAEVRARSSSASRRRAPARRARSARSSTPGTASGTTAGPSTCIAPRWSCVDQHAGVAAATTSTRCWRCRASARTPRGPCWCSRSSATSVWSTRTRGASSLARSRADPLAAPRGPTPGRRRRAAGSRRGRGVRPCSTSAPRVCTKRAPACGDVPDRRVVRVGARGLAGPRPGARAQPGSAEDSRRSTGSFRQGRGRLSRRCARADPSLRRCRSPWAGPTTPSVQGRRWPRWSPTASPWSRGRADRAVAAGGHRAPDLVERGVGEGAHLVVGAVLDRMRHEDARDGRRSRAQWPAPTRRRRTPSTRRSADGTPLDSRSTMSCTLHDVHEPQSAKASITTSQRRRDLVPQIDRAPAW